MPGKRFYETKQGGQEGSEDGVLKTLQSLFIHNLDMFNTAKKAMAREKQALIEQFQMEMKEELNNYICSFKIYLKQQRKFAALNAYENYQQYLNAKQLLSKQLNSLSNIQLFSMFEYREEKVVPTRRSQHNIVHMSQAHQAIENKLAALILQSQVFEQARLDIHEKTEAFKKTFTLKIKLLKSHLNQHNVLARCINQLVRAISAVLSSFQCLLIETNAEKVMHKIEENAHNFTEKFNVLADQFSNRMLRCTL